MSRLIVKGLPATMTEQKLRAIFSERGTVTDCQLKYTREGKFRRFAFVGFDNERDAEDARQHLNRTFVNASRIEARLFPQFLNIPMDSTFLIATSISRFIFVQLLFLS